MPPRYCSLAIVVFWLATTGWLWHRDIWPSLRPGQAPPFTIDLADEAQLHATRIRWVVLRATPDGETKIGRARTWVSYRASDDTFELHNEIDDLTLGGLVLSVRVPHMATMYRVTPTGALRSMTARVHALVGAIGLNLDIHGDIAGDVRDGQLICRGAVESPAWGKHDLELQPVPVAEQGAILNPMHPVNRIADLQPGQHWRMPVVDPLTDAVAARLAKELPLFKVGPRFLNAEVLTRTQPLTYEGKEVPCLIIEYRGEEDVGARTWVRQSDGLVLRQEATGFGDRVILQRE